MQQYIFPFLAIYKQLSLQGIGTFSIAESVPEWQAVVQEFAPPMSTISFSNGSNITSEEFINYVSNTTAKGYSATFDAIQEQVAHLKSASTINIDGIGILQKENNTIYAFTPNTVSYLLPTKAAKVVRPAATHTIRVGEQHKTNIEMQEFYEAALPTSKWTWWHTALTMSVIIIAYLVYYLIIKHNH